MQPWHRKGDTMPSDKNFTVKLTLSEANTVREALRTLHDKLQQIPLSEMTDEQKVHMGNIEKMQRIDF